MKYLFLITVVTCMVHKGFAQSRVAAKPNIIFLYADDLGYGDIGCNGAIGVKTPNIDALARGGINFTDAHSSSSTCTPSRFSLLTGKYAFRNNAAILPGDAPLLIQPGTPTLPAMLKSAGYTTAVVGKWHLGLGSGVVNWNEPIAPGADAVGFDYSYIFPATADRVPTIYIENGRVVNADPADPIEVSYAHRVGSEPTGLEHPELLRLKADTQHSQTIVNGVSRIGFMSGGKSARWRDEDFADLFSDKAVHFIEQNKNKPFFLYYAFPNIHVPRLPNERFKGKSSMGSRGDAIAEMDWITGKIMNTLRQLHLEENTLIFFSSDNGPILDDGYADSAEVLVGRHKPAGVFRGGKYSAFEGGTVMPTITYWPGVIRPAVSGALISQVDLFASLAALVGVKTDKGAAPDSRNMLPALLGKTKKGRSEMIEESYVLSLRSGKWKYIEPGTRSPDWLRNKKVETGLSEEIKLFNLSEDPQEKANRSAAQPDIVARMKRRLEQIRTAEGGK